MLHKFKIIIYRKWSTGHVKFKINACQVKIFTHKFSSNIYLLITVRNRTGPKSYKEKKPQSFK